MLGRVDDHDLPRLVGAADVFAMLCRNRWLGLEQEGVGIVFLEAAAAGVAQVAGRSGGADEAVIDGQTGLVVADPGDPGAVAHALRRLLVDDGRCGGGGWIRAARARVEESFGYGFLARRLAGRPAGRGRLECRRYLLSGSSAGASPSGGEDSGEN